MYNQWLPNSPYGTTIGATKGAPCQQVIGPWVGTLLPSNSQVGTISLHCTQAGGSITSWPMGTSKR